MDVRQLTPFISVSPQINAADIGLAASLGFRAIIANRPEKEGEDQPLNAELEEACLINGLGWHYLPVVSGNITDADVQAFAQLLATVQGPVLAFCRTGTRSTTLWALSEAHHLSVEAILRTASAAGYDLSAQRDRLGSAVRQESTRPTANVRHDVLIVGGGAGGQAVAASLLKRQPDLDIAIIEPNTLHYYQPGWTLVGGSVFERKDTVRNMASVMPDSVKWYQTAASLFLPEHQQVQLEDGTALGYRTLVVAAGLSLNWQGIKGLKETLGQNGVTSNYQFDLAPYTWELVQSTRCGKALFSQPPMPIKCAGAPQKAMYLSCDHWLRQGRLNDINVEFCTAGAALFGVADYVPALMKYVEKYGIQLNFQHNLIEVDGAARRVLFRITSPTGEVTEEEKSFDMLHVCPPQQAPAFIRNSPLADAAGWVDVDTQTLQHKRHGDIFALGDCANSPNAKTAAAVRKQAPVVAENVLMALQGQAARAIYDGYGSCPLTVERGKIVLAEFGYGGKLLPSFPSWLLEGREPSRLSWLLKEKMLPWLYWEAMLKGREWLAAPQLLEHSPVSHSSQQACDFGERK